MSNSFNHFVEYMRSEEGKAAFAKAIVRNRLDDILFGYKSGHLTKEKAIEYLEEIIADHKEVK